jgi:hypothetical protein
VLWHFRYRTVLTLVARQNGKTALSKVISAFFLFVLCVRLVIGTSTNLEAAEEVWEGVVDIAQESPDLSGEVERVYRSAGNKTLTLTGGQALQGGNRQQAAEGAESPATSCSLTSCASIRHGTLTTR